METEKVEASKKVNTNLKQKFYVAKPSILKAFFEFHFREIVDLSKLEGRKTVHISYFMVFLGKFHPANIIHWSNLILKWQQKCLKH